MRRPTALLALCLAGAACTPGEQPGPPRPLETEIVVQHFELPDGETDEGRRLALTHCQMCHLFPEPALLERRVWKDHILPRMGARLGMHAVDESCIRGIFDGEPGEEARRIAESGIYPDAPQVPPESWERIKAWYLANSPETIPPPPGRRPIPRNLRLFRPVAWQLSTETPATTLLQIDASRGRLLYGDSSRGTLTTVSARGEVLEELDLGVAPVWVRRDGDSMLLLAIGSFMPSDLPNGAILRLQRSGPGSWTASGVMKDLQRPVDAAVADLSGDGRDDVVICEYGNQLGCLAWYETLPEGGFERHVLSTFPGAICVEVLDMNRDGRLDVVALFAQNREGVFVYYNEGDGTFSESYVVQLPPSYGSSHMEIVDDGDGHPDLLLTCGDNADYPPFHKPYHGVRLYRNDGRNRFDEVFFHPLFGAYKALLDDYDQDGLPDMAVISMFPDFEGHAGEGFVLLRGTPGGGFRPSTFPEVESGRWITMDSGDLDGDGDTDLVLGSFTALSGSVPESTLATWKRRGLPLLFLENTLR